MYVSEREEYEGKYPMGEPGNSGSPMGYCLSFFSLSHVRGSTKIEQVIEQMIELDLPEFPDEGVKLTFNRYSSHPNLPVEFAQTLSSSFFCTRGLVEEEEVLGFSNFCHTLGNPTQSHFGAYNVPIAIGTLLW